MDLITEYYAIYVLQDEKKGQVLRRLRNFNDINNFKTEQLALEYLKTINAKMEIFVILKEYRIIPK